MINYDGKRFRPVSSSENGEVDETTIFEYQQEDDLLTSTYSGGKVKKGHLIGKVSSEGVITMSYHQVNLDGDMTTGVCQSTPEILPSGKIRLHEEWQWTSGEKTKGHSILEEVS
jgi:hypothetical protein